MQYRADIDGLRAIAVVPVVLFHAGLGFHGGFVGVDIFFVLSGYLLSSIIIQEMSEHRFSFLRFYERRFRRLAPAFVVILAVTYLAFSAIMLPEDLERLSYSALSSIFFYANFHFYHTIDYFSQSAELMPLLHMWSLAIEEQFYGFLPISVLLTLWVFPRRWLAHLIGVALLCSLILNIYYTNAHRPFAFYMPYTRAWELLVGTLLAALPHFRGNERIANWMGSAAFFVIFIVIFTYDERLAFPGWLAVAPVFATAALIYCGGVAPSAWPIRLLTLKPLIFVGKISYSLYLWHWPIIVFARYADLSPDSLPTKLICVVISVVLATLSWALIEQPVRRRTFFASQSAIYIGAGTTALALSLVAALIIWRDGMPARVPDQFHALLDQARADTQLSKNCFFTDRAMALTAEPCFYGKPEQDPTFILFGDSHANALSPGLFAAAELKGMAGLQWTAPGLFPGLGRKIIGSGRTDPRVNHFLELLEERPEINTVIISASWADHTLGMNWKGQSWLYEDNEMVAQKSADNAEIAARAIVRLIGRLQDRQVIILDDVPAGLELDLKYFLRRSMLGTFRPESAALPYENVINRRAAYVPMLETIAAQFDNVEFVPVFENFCATKAGCQLFDGENLNLNYRDGDHLSEYGALSWTPAFRDYIFE